MSPRRALMLLGQCVSALPAVAAAISTITVSNPTPDHWPEAPVWSSDGRPGQGVGIRLPPSETTNRWPSAG